MTQLLDGNAALLKEDATRRRTPMNTNYGKIKSELLTALPDQRADHADHAAQFGTVCCSTRVVRL